MEEGKMIHVSAKHELVGVPAIPQLTALFPTAKKVTLGGKPSLLIRHGIDETRLMRNLGLDIPTPVLTHYDWEGGSVFDVQKKTVAMMTMNRRGYVLNGMGCVDADTEYLSPTGWAKISQYSGGEVAQYNLDGTIELVAPTQFVKLPCQDMIRFKTSRGVDQLLSPEHRVLLADGRVVNAEDIENTYGNRASRQYAFRTTFKVVGKKGIPLSSEEIRVQVAVNADGYCPADWNKAVIRLKKPRKIERLRGLLTSAGISYKEVPCAPSGFVRFTFVPPMTKGFGPTWWDATQDQLEVVADEVTHWDGSFRKSDGHAFSSRNLQDAEFVQYAYSAGGRRAVLAEQVRSNGVDYNVFAKSGISTVGIYGVTSKGALRNNVRREPSTDGFKYCFMVPSTFLLLRRNGCIFATGNTGKTKAALWAWRYLNRHGEAGKLLVVAPLSTLNFTWAKEIFQTLPGVKVQVLYGTRQRRLSRLADMDADIYIINHDGLATIAKELETRKDIDTCVLDELAVYRNGTATRTKVVRQSVKRMKWAWGLTGSPTPNAPTDAWSQCTILTPDRVPKYFTAFRNDTMTKITQFKWAPKANSLDIVLAAMSPAVRFTLDDVLELPEIVERVIEIEMGELQSKIYREMAAQAVTMIRNQEITAMNAGAVLSKLLQISTGYVYSRDKRVHTLDNEARLDAVVDVVNSTDQKVIVFVPFVHALKGIAKKLEDEGYEVRTVSGATPKDERDTIFQLFQNTGSIKVLVAHPQCMAHGLTLTSAATIVWFSPTANLDIFEQANARIRRIGQNNRQQILMFSGTKAEAKMYAKLRAKQKVQDALLELFEDATV